MLGRRALRLNHALRAITRSASTSTSSTSSKANDTALSKQEGLPTPTIQQAPNYPATWSTSQRPRPAPGSSPIFEQTAMELQPNPLSAMSLIAEEPIRLVHGRKASCDGGGGPLGHPKIYINLNYALTPKRQDQPGPRACGYCGLRFEQDPHHH